MTASSAARSAGLHAMPALAPRALLLRLGNLGLNVTSWVEDSSPRDWIQNVSHLFRRPGAQVRERLAAETIAPSCAL